MERHVPPATHFLHLDLSSGMEMRVPLGFLREDQALCTKVMLVSQHRQGCVSCTDNLCADADLQFCGAGSATLTLTASHDLSAQLREGEKLLFAVCSVSEILAVQAWATIVPEFIPVMLGSGRGPTPSIPPAPDEYPWAASMLYPKSYLLSDEGRQNLIRIGRIFMAAMVNHCREALARNDDPDLERRYKLEGQARPDGPDEPDIWFTNEDR